MEAKDIAEELQEANVGEVEESKEAEAKPPEKMLSVSRVNELVKKAKRDGERKMQEQLDTARQQIQQLQGQEAPQEQQMQEQAPQEQGQQQPQQQGVDPAMAEQVMQMMQKKMQEDAQKREQEQLEQEVNDVAKQYFGKLAEGKGLHEDFEAITAGFDATAFPQLVYLANESENTAAIIYELQKNPSKLATLSHLVDRSPSMARAEIQKLSKSISTNQDAKNNVQDTQDPLDRLKSSPTGADNGKMGLRDYKKASFLRG